MALSLVPCSVCVGPVVARCRVLMYSLCHATARALPVCIISESVSESRSDLMFIDTYGPIDMIPHHPTLPGAHVQKSECSDTVRRARGAQTAADNVESITTISGVQQLLARHAQVNASAAVVTRLLLSAFAA